MANLANSAVAIQRRWAIADRSGKLVGKVVDAILTLTGQGTATNKILASSLGLSEIWAVKSCRADGDTLQLASPSYDGTYLLLYDVENATDASRSDPADVTDTIRVIVEGRE